MNPDARAAAPDHHRVVVVGAGFSGIGAAVTLLREGIPDFVVLDRGTEVGGTWRDNTYPGCQCDVPASLYSFSFATSAAWQRSYPFQPELRAYLRRVAREQGVEPHVRLGTTVEELRWDDGAQRWELRTRTAASTATATVTADVVVLGNGWLSEPKVPDLPGLDRFQGTTFHSASWDHQHDLAGERVAVIGTGASAIQFTPHVQQAAAHVTVFQRTPPWVLPHWDRAIPAWERALYEHVPFAQKVRRAGVYWLHELVWAPAFTKRLELLKVAEARSRRMLRASIDDPDLRAKVTPDYSAGCKRLLLSDHWYRTLAQPDVDVVADGIVEVRERSIVTSDGAEHEVDTIIFGTGFHVTDHPIVRHVRGRDGRTLAEVWAERGMRAYKGTTVPGFPNLFVLLGPNTGLAHTSVVVMVEAQLRYVAGALRAMARTGAAELEVTQEATDAWTAAVQAKLAGTVWQTGGCVSWYQDAEGRNPVLWPDTTWRFGLATRRFDVAAYRLGRRRDRSTAVPAPDPHRVPAAATTA